MTKEELIRNLKYTMEKHKNDKVDTFGTNISLMCKDVLDYLEQSSDDCVSRKELIAYLTSTVGLSDEDMEKVLMAINDVPPVTPTFPKGATNGDVIKVMFPNAKIVRGLYGISGTRLMCLNLGTRHDVHEMSFVEDWWNAPYKRGSENGTDDILSMR